MRLLILEEAGTMLRLASFAARARSRASSAAARLDSESEPEVIRPSLAPVEQALSAERITAHEATVQNLDEKRCIDFSEYFLAGLLLCVPAVNVTNGLKLRPSLQL